jgi:uncharacterized PurR-regulated membrane protein YhhQ (DUF165 family)
VRIQDYYSDFIMSERYSTTIHNLSAVVFAMSLGVTVYCGGAFTYASLLSDVTYSSEDANRFVAPGLFSTLIMLFSGLAAYSTRPKKGGA